MKLFIHDLDDSIYLKINTQEFNVISANTPTAYCQGCFNCWFKTPGECYIKDTIKHIGGMIGRSEEVKK